MDGQNLPGWIGVLPLIRPRFARPPSPARGEGTDGVGPYVVDFACVRLRLVIEIDGGVHGRDDVVLRGALRQTEIEALGWTVVRFTNDTALGEPWRIDDAIRDRARVLGLL
ncbi:endonuclease domain-containing protein [Brevundimonas sp. AAP58]|uniref:endonuclease domain-containing protein n=1 Tax=Brevundimonas sp. AAP58 TaxID=1523422 RepID=UPI0009EA58D0|nr:DUF559 domain-containing protein [Brevundimonas sp. AAP58]